jgi:ABC-type dipeptide/oligopeptide/nickel transport system permease subunit
MQIRNRIFRHVIAAIVVVGIIAAVQIRPFIAYRKFSDLQWLQTATAEEQRETAHQALGFWFGDPHDVFVTLNYVGDESSIPYLEKAMFFAPGPNEEFVMCTWQHGRDALARLIVEKEAKLKQAPKVAPPTNE